MFHEIHLDCSVSWATNKMNTAKLQAYNMVCVAP